MNESNGRGEPFEIVIAGGGVAALEAVLALRALGLEGARIQLLAPRDEFVYRPLSVIEPFGLGEPMRFPLSEFCAEQHVSFSAVGISEIWPGPRRVLTDAGEELYYDALLIAFGARPVPVYDAALTFRGPADSRAFATLLEELQAGSIERLAFAVPPAVDWALPAYELALMTAHGLRREGLRDGIEIAFVTHEAHPLAPFEGEGSDVVGALLADAGIEFDGGVVIDRVDTAGIHAGGRVIAADRVVSLPRLEVPEMTGIPQGKGGFISVTPKMQVEGAGLVWAAGDATWFPIKQGGIATQQADIAAAGIAAEAGLDVEVPSFLPVVRAALLTGEAPVYLRDRDLDGVAGSDSSKGPLWWPPSKIAGRWLSPYLAERSHQSEEMQFAGLEMIGEDDPEGAQRELEESLSLALRCADIDAREGDYRQALHWLDVAEGLNLALPREYADKREQWRQAAVASA